MNDEAWYSGWKEATFWGDVKARKAAAIGETRGWCYGYYEVCKKNRPVNETNYLICHPK